MKGLEKCQDYLPDANWQEVENNFFVAKSSTLKISVRERSAVDWVAWISRLHDEEGFVIVTHSHESIDGCLTEIKMKLSDLVDDLISFGAIAHDT